jgi:SNF2 family DNA or RNA helicase
LDPHDQIIERVGPMRQMQAGFDREVLVYQIIARDTIDEIVAERLVEKRGVLDATMDALALKPENING